MPPNPSCACETPCCAPQVFLLDYLTATITNVRNCSCSDGQGFVISKQNTYPPYTIVFWGTGDVCGTGWALGAYCKVGRWYGRMSNNCDDVPAEVISCDPLQLRVYFSAATCHGVSYPDPDSFCGQDDSAIRVDFREVTY